MFSSSRKVAAVLVLLDGISVIAAFFLVGFLRGFDMLSFPLQALMIPVSLTIASLYLIDGYRSRTDMMGLDYTSQHAISLISAMGLVLMVTFVIINEEFALKSSRGVTLASFALLIPVTLSYRRFSYRMFLKRHGNRSIVFVGDLPGCKDFMDECARNRISHPILFASSGTNGATAFSPSINIRPLEAILDDVDSGAIQIEAVVIRESSKELPAEISQRLVRLYFRGISTYTLELFHQIYWRKIPLYRINPTWLFQEGFEIAREPVFDRVKRISDIVLALVGLCFFTPFIIIGAIAIYFDDRGPIFFSQPRIGKNRIPFTLLKLRTMTVGSSDGHPYTREGDIRITRVGKFLRASRIDELPQIWNVLRGDMSFIGPRAEWDRLVVEYEKQIPCYYFRHLVKPGITGWAQVNYPYGSNIDDTMRKLEFDLYYIRHFSFVMDAAIILKTVHVMCFGKGR